VTYQPAEIADLILLLALGPVILVSLRRILPTVPSAAYVAFGAMLWSYVFTIAEGFAFPDLFNMFEHIGYAVAGIAFAVLVVQFGRITSSGAERTR
jgi:hypothetical protein